MYSQEVADSICAQVADGDSLRKACIAHGTTHTTFLRWCNDNDALANQYARARLTGTDAEFEALAEIQDAAPVLSPTGSVDSGWVAWKRLQIDTMKWALSKKAPRKYGDKIETTIEAGESVQRIVRELVRAPRTADSDR